MKIRGPWYCQVILFENGDFTGRHLIMDAEGARFIDLGYFGDRASSLLVARDIRPAWEANKCGKNRATSSNQGVSATPNKTASDVTAASLDKVGTEEPEEVSKSSVAIERAGCKLLMYTKPDQKVVFFRFARHWTQDPCRAPRPTEEPSRQ
eukprot:TRINITY_DN25942_c0_g1_i2.p1 TRINITY_DN25942_c0_g1~~TRINITY_DN25942_c0_g1_i2.p1  ORF type:complete len:151 (+),score=14.80 TRINITY_DN25942_c0_g1_i2:425-877(+)